jgi:hypothetical protein
MNTLFKCDGASMDSIKGNLVQAQSYMNQAYSQALKLQKEIEAKEDWTGNAELVAEGFLDILVQYQKAFHGSENPQEEAISALKELDTNLDNFFANWQDYTALEGRTE